MIVNYTEQGWEIVAQRSHGLLAGQIAMHWKVADRPPRWLETLLAIAEHDDAEIELDSGDLLTPQGGPVNFAMKKFELEHCRKLSRFSISKSRYIALLTSLHMEFLHKSEAETNAQAKAFIQEQRKLQEQWLLELRLQRAEVEKTYSLLEWCDAFSLLLCQHKMQPEQRSIEISRGPDGVRYELFNTDADQLTVFPWPFEVSSFQVYFESRIIKQLHFTTPAEFRQAFYNAPVKETKWQLVESKVPEEPKKI